MFSGAPARCWLPVLLGLSMLLAGLPLAADQERSGSPGEATPEEAAGKASNGRPVHQVPSTDAPIVIDGRLDEVAWSTAASISLAYETDPGENIPAPVETVLLITHDRDRFYFAFEASDPEPARIRARLADRDDAFSDDFVGVALDTFNDGRRAFEFFVNPLGVQMDLTMDDVNENEDSSWDAIWRSAGRLTDSGFVVEVAVPFSSLRFPKVGGTQTWGIDALRVYPRGLRRRLAINPLDRDVDCYVCQFSELHGFAGITPGRNLEINPTLTSGYSEERDDFPSGGFSGGDEETEAGLTVGWGITPNLRLSGTANPDFSQVEADVAQLDVNTQFALFFPERRPFFLEDADFFDTNLNAVFTRNVADPSFGVRLTGKQGANAFGVFVAEDELTNLIFPGNQGSGGDSFDFETTDAVLRYRRDLKGNSALGALVTSREGDGYSNTVAGVDGQIRFGKSDSLTFQYLRSETEYPGGIVADFDQPAGAFDDDAFTLTFVHADRDWRGWFVYDDIGDGFRADMGFMPRVGFKHPRGGIQRTWWGEEDDWWKQVRAGVNYDRVEDQSGQRLESTYETWANFRGPKQSFAELFAFTRDRFFDGVDFDESSVGLWWEVQPTGKLFLGAWTSFGDRVDFANTRPGESLVLEPTIRLDVGKHLRTRLSHKLFQLDVEGGTLFEANLTQARFLYQLNLRTFIRAIFQYTDIDRDLSLYDEPEDFEARTEELFTQLLFSYKLNPRTVLFLGYSDNYRGDLETELTQENRALFLKIGYAWVL
ncbi:MAG: carbohydrate binding family 9 domain-containing protein [bacterium]|nr:carbohydrate binding family 9 domain-containing protein [bacterium]